MPDKVCKVCGARGEGVITEGTVTRHGYLVGDYCADRQRCWARFDAWHKLPSQAELKEVTKQELDEMPKPPIEAAAKARQRD